MVDPTDPIGNPWAIRFDLAFVRALLWFATAGKQGEPRPEVHQYLADRYFRLAHYHRGQGHSARAQWLQAKGEYHFRLGGATDPPPAVALSLPVPRPPLFTRVHAPRDPEEPDGAA